MNLSPQWYNAYRAGGFEYAKRREVFMRHIGAGKARFRVALENPNEETFGSEITCWRLPCGRKVLFLCANPETVGSEVGGGNAVGLRTGAVPVTLKFDASVRNVRDERTGKALGDGERFALTWPRGEATVLSFE